MTIALADLLPMDLIRKHLRVDDQDEDDLITLYGESALAWALWYCDNPKLVEIADFPASFKSALLLLIGHSYANREAVTIGTGADALPLAVESLLWSSRNLSGPPDAVAS
ncbi:head-tail connector protein [Pseudomonas typographi]|uniref:head-tail connector protein n=1 Tax=Pseudomonas typographi TaxID=2715964 RepID=UPI001EEE1292|nr:head-tail connector protein [Pseudomonas typographi]MBD1589664.1 phage gp6-like head-tail connector protein [Pseudomonas typographi]